MTAVQATTVHTPTADGAADAYFTHPSDGRPHPAVLLYMDAFGVRPQLTAMADRLAANGYTVLVPNVFYREAAAPVVELPEIIDPQSRPEIFEKIGPMMQALTPELAMRDAGAYLDWLQARPEAAGGPVGLTGYCLGAGLALRTAGTYPHRVAAAAGFHGAQLATDAPDSPHRLAEHITAELYFGHADQDHALPEEQIQLLDSTLTEAGVRFRAEVYRGAPHGYTQADTAAHDEQATERHWSELLDLFERALRPAVRD
ncbi:dienelactone hydrolase family protein [Saccharopolyspora sp. HNM0983]|uniref:Dienelactone hydrolase family protein n=1 Tax=Saccharopolyspora montiporae TaxID=2781240 RepID=A0A929B5L4_9PSEU|nr:dienelactone hydrolase family protein [Saccharopolyspora sp. HNM0983]MBE9373622.1 dienelactone hydrolase family protein [Saccharopolyspora sp. HNM0983]